MGIGGLTVENRTDRVSVYGGLDLTRDKRGLAHARELEALLDRVVRALEAEKDLPDRVAPPVAADQRSRTRSPERHGRPAPAASPGCASPARQVGPPHPRVAPHPRGGHLCPAWRSSPPEPGPTTPRSTTPAGARAVARPRPTPLPSARRWPGWSSGSPSTTPRPASACSASRSAASATSRPWSAPPPRSARASSSTPAGPGSTTARTACSSRPPSCGPPRRPRPRGSRSTSAPAWSRASARSTPSGWSRPSARACSTSSSSSPSGCARWPGSAPSAPGASSRAGRTRRWSGRSCCSCTRTGSAPRARCGSSRPTARTPSS